MDKLALIEVVISSVEHLEHSHNRIRLWLVLVEDRIVSRTANLPPVSDFIQLSGSLIILDGISYLVVSLTNKK